MKIDEPLKPVQCGGSGQVRQQRSSTNTAIRLWHTHKNNKPLRDLENVKQHNPEIYDTDNQYYIWLKVMIYPQTLDPYSYKKVIKILSLSLKKKKNICISEFKKQEAV